MLAGVLIRQRDTHRQHGYRRGWPQTFVNRTKLPNCRNASESAGPVRLAASIRAGEVFGGAQCGPDGPQVADNEQEDCLAAESA